MNVRPPMPVQEGFLNVQDAYLLEESSRRGIVDCSNLSPVRANNRLFLWQGDITRLKADAIVNAANSALLGCFQPCHSCIDNAIHSCSGVQSGSPAMRSYRRRVMKRRQAPPKSRQGITFPAGMCCIRWGRWGVRAAPETRSRLLAGCYQSCLDMAVKNGGAFHRVLLYFHRRFPLPQDRAAEIAVQTVSRFLTQDQSIRQVIFNVFYRQGPCHLSKAVGTLTLKQAPHHRTPVVIFFRWDRLCQGAAPESHRAQPSVFLFQKAAGPLQRKNRAQYSEQALADIFLSKQLRKLELLEI